jgi:hypothetical protein
MVELTAISGGAGERALCLLEFSHALRDGVAVDAQSLGGFREMFVVSGEGLLNVELFEFTDRFGQQDVTIQHFVNQSFKSSAHVSQESPARIY